MMRSWSIDRRRGAGAFAGLVFVIAGLGVASPALAAGQGNANGNGNGNGKAADSSVVAVNGQSQAAHAEAPGQQKKADPAPQQPADPPADTGKPAGVAGGSNDPGPAPQQAAAVSTTAVASTSSTSSGDGPGGGKTNGDPTKPQPISNADQNSGGANGQCSGTGAATDGPYCSTRDGRDSANGNGGGNATGRPCAGCVGKADNKNPKGQMPGPQDHNNGYECDGNHGIARGNPAHTGCSSTPPPPPPCVDKPNKPCNPPPPCVDKPNKPCNPPPPCVGTVANNFCKPVVPPPPPPPPACVASAANNFCQPVVPPPPAAVCVPSAANNQCQPAPECVPAANEDENCVAVEGVKAGRNPEQDNPEARVLPSRAGVLPRTGAGSLSALVSVAGFGLLLGSALLAAGRRSRKD